MLISNNATIVYPFCGKLKKDHYANLNEKDVADNKRFWRTVKPLLSDKVKSSEKITLVEGEEIINEDEENAEILNKFFSNPVKNLKDSRTSGNILYFSSNI